MSALVEFGPLSATALIIGGFIGCVFVLAWVVVRVAEWRQREITFERISQGFDSED